MALRLADASDGKKTGELEHVGLFIPLPKGLAKQFPAEGRLIANDSTPAHVTFFYVGKMDPTRADEFLQITREVLAKTGPIQATLGDIGYFDNDDYRVAYSKVTFGKNVNRIRRTLRDRLQAAGIKFSERSPDNYKAHSTLAYLPAGSGDNWDGAQPTGSWKIDTIEVWGLPKLHRIKTAQVGPRKIKDDQSEKVFSMDLSKDRFVHFTTSANALEIMSSGKLLVDPPDKISIVRGVYAVSTVWGRYVPNVQTYVERQRPESGTVAVLFRTNSKPDSAFVEEVTWDRDVVLRGAQIISTEQGKHLIQRAPFGGTVGDFREYVVYR